MSNNKKYYYLKLKDNFFDTEEIKILESMDNGYKYSNILLKMYLKSLKREGLLMFKNNIPYNPKMIATITDHNINDVKQALHLFQELDLIEVLSNGAIYMMDIQNFIGTSSTEADRIRAYRNEVEKKKQELLDKAEGEVDPEVFIDGETADVTNVQQMYDKSTPEKELEKEKELENKDKDKKEPPAFSENDKEYQLAAKLRKLVLQNNKNTPVPDENPKGLESWAKSIDRLHRLGAVGGNNGYSFDEIEKIIEWSQQDEFWWRNIKSASKLRKQIVRLEDQMKSSRNKNNNYDPLAGFK